MKSFPFTPKQTVVFFPNRMKVKTSPYYINISNEVSARECGTAADPFSAGEEEFVWVNAIGDCTSKKRNPMENDRRLIWVFTE